MTAIEPDVDVEETQGELAIPSEARALQIRYLPHADIYPDPDQPRKEADDELRASIRAEGLRQPIQVRPHPERLDAWMIIDGERRWRGADNVLSEIPAIVREDHDDAARRLIGQLVSNTGKPLTPLEEARAYAQLLETSGLTQTEIAKRLGIKRTTLGDRLRLMELGPWIPLIESGEVPVSHALEHLVPIRGIPDKFHAELIEKLRKDYRYDRNAENGATGGAAMSGYDFGNVLEQCARPLFYPLTKTKTSWEKQPEFDTRNHDAECSCGGILLRDPEDDKPSGRRWCGNPDWWKPLHRKAIAANQPKDGKSKNAPARVPAWAKLPAGGEERAVKGYYSTRNNETELVRDGKWALEEFDESKRFDPDTLLIHVKPEKLVHVKSGSGSEPTHMVLTTDQAAMRVARASYSDRWAKQLETLAAQRKKELKEHARDAAYAVSGQGVAKLLSGGSETRYQRRPLIEDLALLYELAQLLELPKLPEQKRRNGDDTPGFLAWLAKLDAPAAGRLASALAYATFKKWATLGGAIEQKQRAELEVLRKTKIQWPGPSATGAPAGDDDDEADE